MHDEVRWGGQKEGHEGRAWPGIWDNPKNVKKTSSRLAVGGPDPKKSYYSKHCNLGSFVEIIHSDFEPGQGRCCCQSACWHLSKGPAPAKLQKGLAWSGCEESLPWAIFWALCYFCLCSYYQQQPGPTLAMGEFYLCGFSTFFTGVACMQGGWWICSSVWLGCWQVGKGGRVFTWAWESSGQLWSAATSNPQTLSASTHCCSPTTISAFSSQLCL